MTTMGDLERTIVFLASNYASAICQLDGTEDRAKETSDRLIAAREEVEALLTEAETVRKLSELYQAQSLDFCQKFEVEEVRANTYRAERDCARQTLDLLRLECERLYEATRDEIDKLRAEAKKLKSRKPKGKR